MSILNVSSISGNYFKYTPGIIRFIKQYMVLVVMGVLLLSYFYQVALLYTVREIFFKIRKVFKWTFIVMWVYSALEILILVFKQEQFNSILDLFNYFPFTEVRLDRDFNRISSVSFEPPFLAIYLLTISGWMFSYILTGKGIKKYLPTLGVMAMAFFSGSRTILVVLALQLVVFLLLVFNIKKYRRYFVYFLGLFFIGFLSLTIVTKGKIVVSMKEKIETLNFKKNLTTSISNKTRFGMQYANLKVFKEHPLFGVGFGQQGYHNKEFYPKWATKDNYEFDLWYLNEEVSSFPPGFNLYIRILAETGIFGLLLFVTMQVLVCIKLYNFFRKSNSQERVFVLILIVSFIGYFINWFQVDSFRVFGFWLCLSLLFRMQKETQLKNFIKNG
ncbi:hypothetical protein F8C76_12465 [Flagellimonas olearia]|uniref:O-antigen ligase-related domain-containing protein n=1 Tax=Flagellimonas olearia TaxID=552546 RepID=A0A6I1DUX3_9FLAO|nr:O-antigen ligase family protein [Allomuricauda olearia]KAB7528668.1 hypothetical protein F8C76_12465 [Allomuricauda olearia]